MSATPIIADELHIEWYNLPTGHKVKNVYATSSDLIDGATDAPNSGDVWEITRTEATLGEMIATGHLLFAAGDMLAALKRLVQPNFTARLEDYNAARAAIAKAGGAT